MERRRFLDAVAGGAIAGLAGCVTLSRDTGEGETGGDAAGDPAVGGAGTDGAGAGEDVGGTGTSPGSRLTATAPVSPTDDESVPGEHGFPADICEKPIMEDPGIYAITEPAFGSDWADVEVADYYVPDRAGTGTPADETGLRGDQTVVGVAGEEVARAYPVSVLRHHEIVNDDVPGAGGPLIATYCPLCLSGVVARRIVDGAATTFAVTGQLWRPPRLEVRMAEANGRAFGARDTGGETVTVRAAGNLVMYDEATRSYWSQVTAEAICGPAAGTTLEIVPSTVATWADWRREHPGTDVLLPPPHSSTTRDGGQSVATPGGGQTTTTPTG